jgi:hypothetical protein
MSEMILSVDAVVVGRFTGLRPSDEHLPHLSTPWVVTLWNFDVREVLHQKESEPIPQQILIQRHGGDRDRGDRIERTFLRGFPEYQMGHQYVLFLEKGGNIWGPQYGPNSVFLLSHGRVQPFGSHKVALSQAGLTEEEFLQLIRTYGADD